MSTITTYTRKHFDPVHPDPGLLCVEDFAHALPMICRGNGHVTTFWSVGEHCICCAKEAAARGYSRRLVLACLLHDASECYMSDVPRPLKQEMPRYREIEDHLLSVIYEKYLGSDLTAEEQRMMKQIDNDLLWYDLTNLQDYPMRGRSCLLFIKKRRWFNHSTGKYVSRNWKLVAEGTQITTEFASFLKALDRLSRS